MAHVRTQLRDAVYSAILGLPTTGSNVFVDRVYTVQESEVPCLKLSVGDSVELDGADLPLIQRRSFSVRIEVLAKLGAALSATLDQAGLEVETALAAALTVGGKPQLLIYTGAEEPSLSGEGDVPVGSLVLTFDLVAFTQADAPDVFL